MASSASTSTASVEPAVNTNSTGGNKATSSAAASQAQDVPIVPTMKTDSDLKATYGGCGFTFSSRTSQLFRWRCDNPECSAMLKTGHLNGQHYLIQFEPHDQKVHRCESPRLPGGGAQTQCTPRDGPKRKADSCADKPPETVSGDRQVPAKKSTGGHLPIGGASMANDRQHSQDRPPKKAEDAAGDKSKIKSAKGSAAGNLVDGRAAAPVQHSHVHSHHPRGSNEPGTSASPSGYQEAKESKILPPPTPAARADYGVTDKKKADDGAYSYSIVSDKSTNRDIKEKSGAVKQEADDVNSRDAKAGGKESVDPPFREASYESMRNGWNAADDSAGIALSMQGLGRTQIVLNMNLKTGDLRDKKLRQRVLRLLQAEADLVLQQQKSEALRTELLSRELYSNMTDNKN